MAFVAGSLKSDPWSVTVGEGYELTNVCGLSDLAVAKRAG